MSINFSKIKDVIDTSKGPVVIYRLNRLEDMGFENISRLPYSIKILLESLLRQMDGKLITEEDVKSCAQYYTKKRNEHEIPFIPARVLLQDFTGVPAVVDLAAMRSAVKRLGGDPACINPVIPADLVIDHSIQVDYYGTSDARKFNENKEFERNCERYSFLRWASMVFDNFRVIPPGRGIVHQINLEYLASVVQVKKVNNELIAYPDTLVGTDSHTTMINGMGVLGWGVGGIEAEAVMLGQPYHMPVPDVVGFKLSGELKEEVTSTDLVLTITQILREHNIVGKFVEFYGPGLSKLSLPDRATIANMAPEYGANAGFFPVDAETIKYLLGTGRKIEDVDLVKKYTIEQGLFHTDESPEPLFSETLELDMSTVEPSLAGPKRPQDRIPLDKLEESFHKAMEDTFNSKKKDVEEDHEYHRWLGEGGNFSDEHKRSGQMQVEEKYEMKVPIKSGSIVIAAITSCTNTSNPYVMIGAGLLARKAVEHGLKVKPYVKTSLAPGSLVVTEYLKNSGLMPYLEALGFHLVGYGCTTCIGNSGPIQDMVTKKVKEKNLIVAAVLSGNRNFEGRINPLVKANYLVSPPLVVAYAISGTVDIDLKTEPIGFDPNNNPVYLKDIWPDSEDIRQIIKNNIDPMLYEKQYSEISRGSTIWEELVVPTGKLYEWEPTSTYIQEPPFFMDFPVLPPEKGDISGARVLAYLGDSITTDHISPAGEFSQDCPAGQYLISKGLSPENFNSYGSRRGNHEVMMRGTFANINLKNRLVPYKEGGWTRYLPDGEEMTIYDAAMLYKQKQTPLIVIAGKEYGTGSSRDWAAKGTYLIGVVAVIAESFERIHRSNLLGMGILPLQFEKGENADTLGLKGDEVFDILGISNIFPGKELLVVAEAEGKETKFKVISRLDVPIEVEFYRNGGILHTFMRNILRK
ncbi:MAG: aconitate hydratase AcnA [Candidatus Methanoperedens sp.]|nr:aconitate hydratase AcnA [Candidatus Methanoperedens sp.]